MTHDYMVRRLEKLIENMEDGFLLDSKGFTLRYGCVNSIAFRQAKLNLSALKRATRLIKKCFMDLTEIR